MISNNRHSAKFLFDTVAKVTKKNTHGVSIALHHSTETALAKVVNDLLLASDAGSISVLVLLDISAAFDTVDHQVLLPRKENYGGISGTSLQRFRSYLPDRSQFVHYDARPSKSSTVKYVIPQGSIVGPLLILLDMLPLGNIITSSGLNLTLLCR